MKEKSPNDKVFSIGSVAPKSGTMESKNTTEAYENNRDLSRQSCRSSKKASRASSLHGQGEKTHSEDEKEDSTENRSKTRIRRSDPDRDQMSGGEERRSSGSLYSDDYDNDSPSERSLSPYSRSRTPSPSPKRGVQSKRTTSSLLLKKGVVGCHASRSKRSCVQPPAQQHRKGVRSQSKESSPSKDLDLVTKRMLSARLLKINELRNALSEMQQSIDELKKENRILRQLQVRQEKALQRYDDTESEISVLISRHSNEMHVLRERLKRTQERERAAERRSKDGEEQLQRSQKTIARLKRLVDQRELGEKDELRRRLEEEKARAQEADQRIKDLQRSLELNSGSFQRQLVAEKKKSISAQDDIRTLQEELEKITNKLREKERELDARNIYANRMVKPSVRRENDGGAKREAQSRCSTKAIQTEDRTSSLGFPTPPPAIGDVNGCREDAPDEYLSLKELTRGNQQAEEKPKQPFSQELNVLEERARRRRNSKDKAETRVEKEKDDIKTSSLQLNQMEEENYLNQGYVQDEVQKWNQDRKANQPVAEDTRRRKNQLLAKMREIDRENQEVQNSMFVEAGSSEASKNGGDYSSSHPPEQRNRRSLRSQTSNEDLAFGGYAPSFGHSGSRASINFPPAPPREHKESALEAIGIFSLTESATEKRTEKDPIREKDKKSNLMQQLFGAQVSPAKDLNYYKTETLTSSPNVNGERSRREGVLSFSSRPSTPPSSSISTVHVTDSRPAIRAIASFDDDIEELAL
ncbi:lebercilin isoform X2 [Gouania willdenowi]|uniref:Lebercilin domain-containing protein n=1 Tax=Gouania willdenowi TaxID=441366 RepID=A0A8C5EBW5_GOUWI|nr:lebercilin isoform X2 [Gouania willdenowi]